MLGIANKSKCKQNYPEENTSLSLKARSNTEALNNSIQ